MVPVLPSHLILLPWVPDSRDCEWCSRTATPAPSSPLAVPLFCAAGAAVSGAMERSEGLVQRRNVASRERAAGSEPAAAAAAAADASPDLEEPDTDGDSKQARLTLMEQVLMLGLKDREVRAVCTERAGGREREGHV